MSIDTINNICHEQVWIELEKSGEDLHLNFPLTIATCPFRIPNSNKQPILDYGNTEVSLVFHG